VSISRRWVSARSSASAGTSYPASRAATSAWLDCSDCHGTDSRPRAHHDQPPSSFWSATSAAMSAATRASSCVAARQALGVERVEHVAQRRDREDARRVALRRGVAVLVEVDHGVGERLERGGGRVDLEAAELGDDTGGRCDRLAHRLPGLVDHPVGRERLGRGRCVDREVDLGGVARVAADAGDPHPGRPRGVGPHREADLDPGVGRDGDHASRSPSCRRRSGWRRRSRGWRPARRATRPSAHRSGSARRPASRMRRRS
jgi:hypothetical protein